MVRCLSLISSQSLAIGIGITSPTEMVDLRLLVGQWCLVMLVRSPVSILLPDVPPRGSGRGAAV